MRDLHALPKLRDSLSYLYVEHCRVDQEEKAIALHDADGKTAVPCASLTMLLLGPGTTVTHAAMRALADNGCLAVWCGEEGVRLYAAGTGETRSARRLIVQAALVSNPTRRLEVVRRMYALRFPDPPDPSRSIEQLRGREGIRVRSAYQRASRESGVPWAGRTFSRDAWGASDPVNRALSSANSCLYGICHAAIISVGCSPGLGYIHTGKMLSFVYDIADLYKADVTIPLAFREAASSAPNIEMRVRHACRDAFRQARILERIVPDIDRCLGLGRGDGADEPDFDADEAAPGGLWDPDGVVQGGHNYAEPDEVGEEDGPR
jgi:CRISP-associated protein Cas1